MLFIRYSSCRQVSDAIQVETVSLKIVARGTLSYWFIELFDVIY